MKFSESNCDQAHRATQKDRKKDKGYIIGTPTESGVAKINLLNILHVDESFTSEIDRNCSYCPMINQSL